MEPITVDNSLLPAALPHGTEWAIRKESGDQYLQFLKSENRAQHVADFQARMPGESASSNGYEVRDGVAMFSARGLMTKAPTSLDSGCSTVYLRNAIRLAMRDDSVKSAVCVWDTPGGTVSGTSDLAKDIAAFAAKKPFYSFVEDMCCSAGLWCAAQSTALYANENAMVGSIGVLMVLYDMSAYYDKVGVEAVVFATGPYKGTAVEGSVITPEQREVTQAVVDKLGAMFLSAIATGRKMSLSAVEQIAHGGVFIGDEAVGVGLIDEIATFDAVMALARNSASNTTKPRARALATVSEEGLPLAGMTLYEESETALAAVDGLTARLADLKARREQDGRALGDKAQGHLSSLAASLEGATEAVHALLSDAKATPETDDTATIRSQLEQAILVAELATACL